VHDQTIRVVLQALLPNAYTAVYCKNSNDRVSIDVRRAYRKLENLKGTGPDKVPGEILRYQAKNFGGNEKAARGIDTHQLIADRFLNDELPEWVYYTQQLACIVPLLKGAIVEDGTRPISMFSFYFRAWKAEVARLVKEQIDEYFHPLQLEVATHDGGATQTFAAAMLLESKLRALSRAKASFLAISRMPFPISPRGCEMIICQDSRLKVRHVENGVKEVRNRHPYEALPLNKPAHAVLNFHPLREGLNVQTSR